MCLLCLSPASLAEKPPGHGSTPRWRQAWYRWPRVCRARALALRPAAGPPAHSEPWCFGRPAARCQAWYTYVPILRWAGRQAASPVPDRPYTDSPGPAEAPGMILWRPMVNKMSIRIEKLSIRLNRVPIIVMHHSFPNLHELSFV